MREGPHNRPDGRCRYTLGAERCPGVGSKRVGDWWVCDLHVYWAENPGDPERKHDGEMALESARILAGMQRPATSEVQDAALSEMRGTLGIAGVKGPGGAERNARVRRYWSAREALERDGMGRDQAHERALEDMRAGVRWAERETVRLYRDLRKGLERRGMARQEAHERALERAGAEIARLAMGMRR